MRSRKDFYVKVIISSRCRADIRYYTSQTGFPGTEVIVQANKGDPWSPTVRKRVSQTSLSEVRESSAP